MVNLLLTIVKMQNRGIPKKVDNCQEAIMMVHMYEPEQIKNLREEAGMTMAAFGVAVGISESAVSYLESGRSHPRLDTLRKLNTFAEKLRTGKIRSREKAAVSA